MCHWYYESSDAAIFRLRMGFVNRPDSLGGIKANKDNDPYGLAIREGVSTSESSGGRTKR